KRLGAAGAVAQMVAALGCDVNLVGVVGPDDVVPVRRRVPGTAFLISGQGETTRRERFYDSDWNVMGPRVDVDSHIEITPSDRQILAGQIVATVADAVIVCDHAQGVVGPELMTQIRRKGVPIFVDPHTRSDFKIFAGV